MLTPQQAIDAECRSCNADSNDVGTWRQQVESCADTNCPLHEYRPATTTLKNLRKQVDAGTTPPEAKAEYHAKWGRTRMRMLFDEIEQETAPESGGDA